MIPKQVITAIPPMTRKNNIQGADDMKRLTFFAFLAFLIFSLTGLSAAVLGTEVLKKKKDDSEPIDVDAKIE